jgi:phosphoribosyl 1,2-cyclic phosphodiesterase
MGAFVEVTFWGVRGSIPTPGDEHVRWGGNSACLEVRHPGLVPLVFDCGTGARKLGEKLLREPGRELDLLMSHVHMDHLFGLPFFLPVYIPGYQVRVGVPAYSDDEAREKVARYLNGTFQPNRIRDLSAEVTFAAIRPATTFERGGFRVRTCALNHPGGSLGFRVETGGAVFCYVTDTAPLARPGEGVGHGAAPTSGEERLLDLLADADVVVFDTMFTHAEFLERMTWGHSYPEYALALCERARARELVLFHHAPSAADDALDALEARWRDHDGPVRVSLAREGSTIPVGAGS